MKNKESLIWLKILEYCDKNGTDNLINFIDDYNKMENTMNSNVPLTEALIYP